jgi:hypothetical protein
LRDFTQLGRRRAPPGCLRCYHDLDIGGQKRALQPVRVAVTTQRIAAAAPGRPWAMQQRQARLRFNPLWLALR